MNSIGDTSGGQTMVPIWNDREGVPGTSSSNFSSQFYTLGAAIIDNGHLLMLEVPGMV